jgi:hypothetical protein
VTKTITNIKKNKQKQNINITNNPLLTVLKTVYRRKNNYDTGLVKTKFNKVNENNKFFFYKNIRILSCIFQF